MFPTLRLEIAERFTAVESFFKACSSQFTGDPLQTAKGLVFVQLYAIHEYTVETETAVAHAITKVEAHSHRFVTLRPSLFLDPELQSVRDTKRPWESRLRLFERATSKERAVLSGAPVVPADGTHFRHTHVELILRVFGIKKKLTLRKRHLQVIDEVVNHRNAIAHGDETAAQIGRRFSDADVRQRIRQMNGICLRLVRLLEEHCSDPAKVRR